MSPQARRRIIPLFVLLAAAGILLAVIFGSKRQTQQSEEIQETNTTQVETADTTTKHVESKPVIQPAENVVKVSQTKVGKLALKRFDETDATLSLGSLDDYNKWSMKAIFTPAGAGIESIRFSNIFETVGGKLAWHKFRNEGGTQPGYDELYLLGEAKTLQYQTAGSGVASATASILGASQVIINGHTLHLTN